MTKFTVHSITEYIKLIKHFSVDKNQILWFRGHRDSDWSLSPSLWRRFSRDNERSMNHEFLWKAKSRSHNPPIDKDWPAWLSLMQHYRLPTRLLDWSKSPLVALYFAVEEFLPSKQIYPQTDVAVWFLSPGALNVFSGLDRYIFSIQTETAREMIEPAFLNPIKVKENEKIIAVSAIENDIRMMVQQAAFTIHSSIKPLEDYCTGSDILTKVIFPKEIVREIALEIDLLGFKPSIICPDLENLSLEIQLRYSSF